MDEETFQEQGRFYVEYHTSTLKHYVDFNIKRLQLIQKMMGDYEKRIDCRRVVPSDVNTLNGLSSKIVDVEILLEKITKELFDYVYSDMNNYQGYE